MARNNERRARLVNKNGVDLVDNGEIQPSLNTVGLFRDHVVAKVVKAKLVVGAIGNVAGIGSLFGIVVELRQVNACSQAKRRVEPAHPLGITLGKVVVHRDHMHALALKGIQVGGKCGHQGFAFPRAHLGDLAFVQDHATHQLDIEMAHAKHTTARLAAYRKGRNQELIEFFSLSELLAKLGGFFGELGVRKSLDRRFEGINSRYSSLVFLK